MVEEQNSTKSVIFNNLQEKEEYLKIQQRKLNKLSSSNINRCIKIFNTLYETGNLRKTSQILNMSLGSVSLWISKLEYILETKLFHRGGQKGMEKTAQAIKFYEITGPILEMLNDVAVSSVLSNGMQNVMLEEDEVINFAAHPLSFGKYIFPAVKLTEEDFAKENKQVHFNFLDYNRDEALNQLILGKIDAMFYPMEWSNFSTWIEHLEYQILGDYDLRLYMHKDHPLAQKNDDDISWKDANELNLMPRNPMSIFSSASKMMRPNPSKFSTPSQDLLMLYQGIKNNLWSIGYGIEFKDYFDCKDFVIKQIKNSPLVAMTIKWIILYKKTINEEKKIIMKNTISNLEKIFSKK